MGIYEKLSAIQQELKAPKNQRNTFGNYNYRSCEDILEAAKPLCAKYKAALVLVDDIKEIGGRFYVVAQAQLHDCESDAAVAASAFAREPETKKGSDESQITGAASSYARKYALNGLFCIDDTKDADTNENKAQEQKTEPDIDTIAACMRCNRPILPIKKTNGEIWKVTDMVKYSEKRFKKRLCAECMKLTDAEVKANESPTA